MTWLVFSCDNVAARQSEHALLYWLDAPPAGESTEMAEIAGRGRE
jgi:hypothetical protein